MSIFNPMKIKALSQILRKCVESQSELLPDDFRRMIAEFILDHLGVTLSTEQICDIVDTKGFGIRDWKTDQNVNEVVKGINYRYLRITETELINSTQIVRDETSQISDALCAREARGVLLVAPGGYGKSCVLAQVLAHLACRSVPFIAVRMDYLEVCSTSRQLGNQLDLPASPATVLAGIADNAPCVLIVDQLDAISALSGRNLRMWEVFQQLCQEVQSYPNMQMVVACRDYDLSHDSRLRELGDSESGFKRFELSILTKTEIMKSLDIANLGDIDLHDEQLEILAVPFHLLLFFAR